MKFQRKKVLLTLFWALFLFPASHLLCSQDQPSISLLKKKLKRSPHNLKIREQLAHGYFQKEQWQKARDLLAPYASELSEKGLKTLALSYKMLKNYQDEIRILEIMLARKPQSYFYHYLIGLAYYHSKKNDLAVQHLRQSIEINPKHKPSYFALLKIFQQDKNSQANNYESRTLVGDMIRVFGEQPKLVSLQCQLYTEGGFLDEAKKACTKALRVDKKEFKNYIYLASVFQDLQKSEMSKKILLIASKKFSNKEPILWNLGNVFFNSGDYPASIRFFKKALQADPQSARALFGLAQSFYKLSNYDKALKYFVKACQKKSSYAKDFRVAGAQLFKSGNIKWGRMFQKHYYKCN
ncbi:MAG: tetratricopeptide repeat protein [Bdellovibrio sp.]|nr:MAG: tetratricopeptide repeat protein [Bdellovibrio sp.]